MIGKVIVSITAKGYGFIEAQDGENVYFHISNVENRRTLAVGDIVQFGLGHRNGRSQAVQVKIHDDEGTNGTQSKA